MKSIVMIVTVGLLSNAQVKVTVIKSQVFKEHLLVAEEFRGKEAKTMWAVGNLEIEDSRFSTGEKLRVDPTGFRLIRSGDNDPTHRKGKPLSKDRAKLIFRAWPGKQDAKKIERLAGSYKILRGGELRWVDVATCVPIEEHSWEQQDLNDAGLRLAGGVEQFPRVTIELHGKDVEGVSDVVLLAEGHWRSINSELSTLRGGNAIVKGLALKTFTFNLNFVKSDVVRALITFKDGSSLEVEDLAVGPKLSRVRSGSLKGFHGKMRSSRETILRVWAAGTGLGGGLLDSRWTGSSGIPLKLESRLSLQWEGDEVFISTIAPRGLPKGAKLQLSVAAGAAISDVEFDYTNIKLPNAK